MVVNINKPYNNINKCRISDSQNLIEILDLGKQPLANSLKKNCKDSEIKIPLSISFCPESSLVQLKETVDKNILFDNYVWVTGTSAVARNYSNIFFQRVIQRVKLDKSDFIIEIASNDGLFLKTFIKNGFQNVIGIEPAKNIALVGNEAGVKTLNDYWDFNLSKKIVHQSGKAKIVFARNVIPHVANLLDVMAGIENALSDGGIGIIEFHQAGSILQDLQYDSIYHEHLCYFSIKSINFLLNRFNMSSFHIDVSPISGGSYVIYFSKEKRDPTKELLLLVEQEDKSKVNELEAWIQFAKKTRIHREKTLHLLKGISDKTIVGFGSSARSQTFLNYCGIGSSYLNAIIDNNKLKQGLYTPGSSIPIVSLNEGMKRKPDIIFILAWNFKDEIMEECRDIGFNGDFLIPFPNEPYFLRK